MEKQIRKEGFINNQIPEICKQWKEFRSSKKIIDYLYIRTSYDPRERGRKE